MKRFKILTMAVVMCACLAVGGAFAGAANADVAASSEKVFVATYGMSLGGNGNPDHGSLWGYTSEDEYALFNGATQAIAGKKGNVILEVTVPKAGTISFADGGTFAKISAPGGDGGRARLILNDRQLYPTDAAWAAVPATDQSVVLSPADVTVSQGDKLYLVLDNGGNFNSDSDQFSFCLGFKLDGAWFGSDAAWYDTDQGGEAEIDFAGVTVKKNQAVRYCYGSVSDAYAEPALDESGLATKNVGALVDTYYDEAESRFKGTENSYSQFEAWGTNLVAGVPNAVRMTMSAAGTFCFQNSYLYSLSGTANLTVLKNDKVIYPLDRTAKEITAAVWQMKELPTVSVAKDDTVTVLLESQAGAYLKYAINGVLAAADRVECYSVYDSVMRKGGNCAFYTTKQVDGMGDVTDKTLTAVKGVDAAPMFYDANSARWSGREQFCLIWKEASGLKVHTGATYNPSIAYEFPAAGKAQIRNLRAIVESNLSDGIRFRVLKMTAGSPDAYEQLYPLAEAWQTVTYDNKMQPVDTEIVSVAAGDRLILVVNLNETQSTDQTDVSFDVAFEAEGAAVQVYNAVGGFTNTNDTAWKYLDATIPVDYSSTVVGEAEQNQYVSLKQAGITLKEMTYFKTLGRWGIAGQSFLQIESGSLHPGSVYAAAIGIKMPEAGRVDLSQSTFKYDLHATPDADGNVSDGVRIRILRNNTVIFPLDGGWQEIKDAESKTFDIPVFEVAKDDMIYVVVDCGANGKENYDLTYATILAHFAVAGSDYTTTFDSKNGFLATDEHFDAFSYWGFYYDASATDPDDKPVDPDDPDDKPDDPIVVDPGCGGCGGSAALQTVLLAAGALALCLRRKG